ncbi:acyl-CoA synthetase, putative [Stappia aggregata IAM 12614]|uniref:Acyl-CoA synthetase, putative n=1 Tax=Roseibium aggregatum (strain ATCC 25650 / DSM 13394 / JCM 20685 / NBRC 16684 / NCIMB 2208 / IAM 12614 / B1) TaxID=384765 RepID=A0NVW8_ROSAI|nr:acetate--CoA ligase family protein [Roseibium aggregatum]EAV43133.1 acyl-CoA synthetase, putative [Stappia aggregata IAM 12614] [Roseibium aggregatum IAM 12614]
MRSLERLLRPRSVAIIGGGSWCRNVLRECRKAGFAGNLWPVHPSREEIDGCRAYASVEDLPSAPDAVFIGVNRQVTVEVVRSLASLGAGGAICFASGFSEAIRELADGADLQAALIEAAGDMPILGPNCYGFLNALDGAALWPDQHGLIPVERGVAIIAQSSNIALNLTMQARGLPIAYLMTAGNQAQTGLSVIGSALLDDDRVTAIGLHIEGLDDLAAFEAFARKAHALGKPVVALKVGRSEAAQAATVSHTAALAGSTAGSDALFKRLGIASVGSLPALLETLKLVHVAGPLPSANIVSMSCSGGEASLIADTAVGRQITFPPLGPAQRAALSEALGPKVALANPLDYHTYIWGDGPAMTRCYIAMMQADVALGIVILDIPRLDRCDPEDWLKVIEPVEAAMKASGKPMAIVSSLPETMPEALAADLMKRGLVPLCGLDDALTAIEAAAFLACPLSAKPIRIPRPVADPRLLSEQEAKALLQRYGLKAPASAIAGSPEAAAHAAEEIGFPVALKGTGIAHKTEAGAVALDLQSACEVHSAASGMPASSFLVEEMITGSRAELLVGIVRDPAHGYVLTLAAGGILTELLEDSTSLIVPASDEEIRSALENLKIGRVLTGYRGKPPCDLEAIVEAVQAVQAFVLSAPVEEVEINPLLCGVDFAIAVDALVRMGEN